MVVVEMRDVDYKRIGERIRILRQKHGLTQEKLSEIVGCSNNHLSHIENASCKVSLGMLVNIAAVFNSSLDYFFFDTPFARPEALINTEISTKLQKCSPETLAALNRILDALLELQKTPIKHIGRWSQ